MCKIHALWGWGSAGVKVGEVIGAVFKIGVEVVVQQGKSRSTKKGLIWEL